MKTYYHVSSLRNKGDKLLRTGKIGYDYCCYANTCDLSTFEKYIECYNNLCLSNVFQKTKRTPAKWLCEYVFEKTRKQYFSMLPSRLWGVYLVDSFEEAKNFLFSERNYPGSKIFEIVVVNDSSVHCFDMSLFTKAQTLIEKDVINSNVYIQAFEFAKSYWESNNSYVGKKEFLIEDDSLEIGKEVFCWTPKKI